MSKKIIIIGGGIAGLSTGCYGGMNGYETEIFEMHTSPGGVCTGWVRQGYTFDGCLHWLTGSAPESAYYKIWNELGVLKGNRVINHEQFCHVLLSSGKHLIQYADIDRLINSLKENFPEDSMVLDQLRDDVKLYGKLRMPLPSVKRFNLLRKIRGFLKIRPYLPLFKRYKGSIEDYLSLFNNPELKEFFRASFMLTDMPAISLVGLLSFFHKGEAGWPEGGSLAVAKSIEKRYLELGGQIRYGKRVEEIIVNNKRAVGIRLADGSEHYADEIISAADGHTTIFGMLKGRFISRKIEEYYKKLPLYTPFVQVSYGVKCNMTNSPRLIVVCFSEPIKFGGTPVSWLFLNNYAFDSSMAPSGKTALTVLFWSPYDHWEKFSSDRAGYLEEKKLVLKDVSVWLESYIHGITGDIEVTDVATPLTTVRYTGNYRSSYEGWRPTTGTIRMKLEKTLPGLKNFFMTGQWTKPFSGLPTVAVEGRMTIEKICLKEGKEFITTCP